MSTHTRSTLVRSVLKQEQIITRIAFDYKRSRYVAMVVANDHKITLRNFNTKIEAATACNAVKTGLLGGVQ